MCGSCVCWVLTLYDLVCQVEGLLGYFKRRLEEGNPFQATTGDSREDETHHRFVAFMAKLDAVCIERCINFCVSRSFL